MMLSQIEWKKLLVIAVLVGVIGGTVLLLMKAAFGISLPPVWMVRCWHIASENWGQSLWKLIYQEFTPIVEPEPRRFLPCKK